MSIVIVTVLAVILAFFVAKSIYVSSKPKETSISTSVVFSDPTPETTEPVVVNEPVVIENSITTPVVLGSDDIPTKPKPKKKPAAKMSAAPKKAPKKKPIDA